MNKDDFVACFGFVYEHSPWIAEIGWDRELTQKGNTEYDSAEKIHKVLRDVVNDASRNRKLQLLQAHPDLAGKLAVAGKITGTNLRPHRSFFLCIHQLRRIGRT